VTSFGQPRRRRARVPAALAVLAASALAGCGSSARTSSAPQSAATGSTPDTSAQASHAGACGTRRLALGYGGTEGATGHLEVKLTVRNASRTACTVRGYPGARLLDAAGRTLPMRVHRGGGFFPDAQRQPRTVTLLPGRRARYGLSFVTNNEYARARHCVTAATLDARLPGSSRWTRIVLAGAGHPRITPCGTQLVVSPVYLGA
jgi:hypothetical protein